MLPLPIWPRLLLVAAVEGVPHLVVRPSPPRHSRQLKYVLFLLELSREVFNPALVQSRVDFPLGPLQGALRNRINVRVLTLEAEI